MKLTATFILATSALISATPIDAEVDPAVPAAPAGLKHLRIMFNHDFDCKWRHKGKGETHQNPKDWKDDADHRQYDMPACDSKDFKDKSYMFDFKDEQGKCFSPKDLKFSKEQHNFHSFSYCLPKRLEEKGCKFYLHEDVHCESEPLHVIDSMFPHPPSRCLRLLTLPSTAKNKATYALKMGQCMNIANGKDEPDNLNVGGARSIRVECPAKKKTVCDPSLLEKADEWFGLKLDDA